MSIALPWQMDRCLGIGPAKVDKRTYNVVQYIIAPRRIDGRLGDIMIVNVILVGCLVFVSMAIGLLMGISIGRIQILEEQNNDDIRQILDDLEWDGQTEM